MDRPHSYKFKYVCNICDHGTYDQRIIKAHIFKHFGEKPLKCPHCSYASSYRSHLIAHVRSKHLKHIYSCTHCTAFGTHDIDSLVEHCRTCPYMKRPHEYKFKYVCPLCDYGTYDARPLKAHIFKHAGAKPLKCSLCPFATTYQSSLVSHMRTKHG
ncbi:hypothetical protein WDU94_005820 [Cyamophila willieti]